MVGRVVRASVKGMGSRGDEREPITMQLIVQILNIVEVRDHNERCFAAACVVGFLNCLRIGEFTKSKKSDRFLRRSDWKPGTDQGSIMEEMQDRYFWART